MPSNIFISDDEKSTVPSQQVVEQVHRVLHSEAFKGSEVLRHLLEYLLICSLNGRTDSLKVKEIAREVFGRAENFDSQTDSVVRVHTGRLRSKLAEYYIGEGADDDLIVGIPKGSYGLTWHARKGPLLAPIASPPPNLNVGADTLGIAPALPANRKGVFSFPGRLSVAGAALLALALLGNWAWLRTRTVNLASVAAPGPGLTTFWHSFVGPREQPLIVFSTFRLGGSLDTEVHPLTGEASSPGEINTYTTTGEVMGVFEVTRMLASFGQSARAKHGQLLTWDEAKDSNLIFVGGPLAQTPLRSLPAMKELQFRKGLPGLPPAVAAILNIHPQGHEERFYPGPTTRPYRFDYGVIAIKPTFNPNRRALILAGITEYGTQGAADFVTQEDRVNELLGRLGLKPGVVMPPFEALIRVNIEGDVPVQYELVFAHLVK